VFAHPNKNIVVVVAVVVVAIAAFAVVVNAIDLEDHIVSVECGIIIEGASANTVAESDVIGFPFKFTSGVTTFESKRTVTQYFLVLFHCDIFSIAINSTLFTRN